MRKFAKAFRADRSGAITVDYIVLAAAVVGLGLTTASAVGSGAFDGIANMMEDVNQSGCVVTGAGTTDLSACN